jgi:NTP pyrophosphatase (non-canonical NTP hydrolase)
MKYEYTREHMLPVMVELTYEDIQLIQKMAKYFIELETMPEGFWKGDMRKLEREVGEVLERVASAASYAFPKTTE